MQTIDIVVPEKTPFTLDPGSAGTAPTSRTLLSIFAALGVVAVALLSFWNSLPGYFLADDLLPLFDLYRAFNGHPEILAQNLISPWLHDRNFLQVYRPLVELTLACDYSIWRSNPLGYHLTNLACHAWASLALYLVSRQLLAAYESWQSVLAAFFAASLFAAFPAHADSVIWIVGRADSLSCAFYLTSLWLFIKSVQAGSRRALLGSLGACVFALLAKEMAISLPAVLAAYYIFARATDQQASFKETIKSALIRTRWFWIAACAYVIGRAFILGTISGGHVGSLGDLLSASWLERTESLWRIAYPINTSVIKPSSQVEAILRSLYFVAGLLMLLRISWHRWTASVLMLMAFVAVWLCLCELPACQVWFLDKNLSGSRFFYMGTAPLSLLFVLMFMPLTNADQPGEGKINTLRTLTAALLSAFVVWSAYTTQLHNIAWAYAANQMQALKAAVETVSATMSGSEKLVILNLPRNLNGVPMFYWFEMQQGLLRPPLCQDTLTDKVAAMDPWFIGNEQLLNLSKLKEMRSSANPYIFFVWDQTKKVLAPVENILPEPGFRGVRQLPVQFTLEPEHLERVLPGSKFVTGGIDFVDVDLTSAENPDVTATNDQPATIALLWSDESGLCFDLPRTVAAPVIVDGKRHTYRLPVSQYPAWILAGQVQLALRASGNCLHKVQSIRLINGETVIPKLSADQTAFDNGQNGVYMLKGKHARFLYDASAIAGTKTVVVEFSGASRCFQHYSGSLRDTALSEHAVSRLKLFESKGEFELPPDSVPRSAKFQIRMAAVSATGQVLGTTSDPLTVEFP